MLGHHGFDWRFLPGTPGPVPWGLGADGRGRKAETLWEEEKRDVCRPRAGRVGGKAADRCQ